MEIISSEIFIRDMLVHAPIGVIEQERVVGNDIIISLSASYPVAKAMLSDDVSNTLNYADVAFAVRNIAQKPTKLLERLVHNIADELFRRWPAIEALDITATKVTPPISLEIKGAGVHLRFINSKAHC